MSPFDFIITLLSFVYSLALALLLTGVGRIVRHRRTITLSWIHALWTTNTGLFIVVNWLALWDFRQLPTVDLTTVASGTLFALLLFLMATFVTPDVEQPEERDLRKFHDRERHTYVGAAVALVVLALVLNWAAGHVGVTNWVEQNLLVITMLPVTAAALFARRDWLQVALALAFMAAIVAFGVFFYPVLR